MVTTEPVQQTETLQADRGTFMHELSVVQRVYSLLGELDRGAQHRVLEYVIKRHDADTRTAEEAQKRAAYSEMEKKMRMERELDKRQAGTLSGAAGLRGDVK